MTEPAQLFQNAKQLADEGHWAQSLAVIQGLVKNGRASSEQSYYIGYNKFKLGDFTAASSAFQHCLKTDPGNANCNYWLGQIAETQNQTRFAESYYSRALEINPLHKGALGALSRLRPKPVSAQFFRQDEMRDHTQTPAEDPGFYGLLRSEPSTIARQAIQLIDGLEMEACRPRLAAYLGRICFILFVVPFLLLGYIVLALSSYVSIVGSRIQGTVMDSLPLMMAVAGGVTIVLLVVLIVRVRSRRISFHQGRIKIVDGVFHKHWWNIELYRVVDLSLHQTFWNRLTGDGSMTLFVTESQGKNHAQVRMRGLKEIAEMELIIEDLRNVVFLLRTGNWGKGIIY